MLEDDEDNFAATQPVMSMILKDVVAYVEVRSGHDNRSRGVKAQLRSLGATVIDTLTSDVTHVVFNEGLPSTYKKAKKFKCHLVSVLWIAACKEKVTLVGEAGYPPIGQQIYENPSSLKKFKKLKSMQPDFDDEEAERKFHQVRKQLQRRKPKVSKAPARPEDRIDVTETLDVLDKASKLNDLPQSTIGKRGPKTCGVVKNSKKKAALKELTLDVVNQEVTSKEVLAETAPNNPQSLNKVKLVGSMISTSRELESSSSSVIFVGDFADAGPSTKGAKKLVKCSDSTPISRSDLIEGLSNIVRSFSEEKTMKKCEMSLEVRPGGPASLKDNEKGSTDKKLSPRRSPRNAANPSQCFVSPTTNPRKAKENKKQLLKTKAFQHPTAASASATLAQKWKKVARLPESPTEDFMLLSQEFGDMPSIDEIAKMKRISMNSGEDHVTLTQIIRAYDTAAVEKTGSCGSYTGDLSCVDPQHATNVAMDSGSFSHASTKSNCVNSIINVEDVSHTAEELTSSENCPSETGSTTSSLSTRVLINGLAPDFPEKTELSSCLLPGSEEVDLDKTVTLELDQISRGAVDSTDKLERVPSPIFVIKKSNFRRLLKRPDRSNQASNINQSSLSTLNAVEFGKEEKRDAKIIKEKRESLSPIDFINKFFLPKFSLMNKTPSTTQKCQILVDDTPIVDGCTKTPDRVKVIIPPSPAENNPQIENAGAVASPTQSLTSSVVTCVKKSSKLPLFSPRASKTLQTCKHMVHVNEEESRRSYNSYTSEAVSEKRNTQAVTETGTPSSARRELRKKKSPNSQKDVFSCKSLCNQQVESNPHCPSTEIVMNRREREKEQDSSEVPAVSYDNDTLSNSLLKQRNTRSRVRVTVLRNEEPSCKKQTENINICPSKISPLVKLRKLAEGHSSSGYESSHSDVHKKGNKVSNSTGSLAKQEKVSDLFTQLTEATKKRSEIYENEESLNSMSKVKADACTTLPHSHTSRGRKRNQCVQNLDSNKKLKLKNSDSEKSPVDRTMQLRRVNTRSSSLTRLESDLSFHSSKFSVRKSSEEAKKRLAKSLTRNHHSNAPKIIVCTYLTASEQNGIEAAGERLEGWRLEQKVTNRTTHVINSGPKRTLNMLKGMARGCWLVDQNWMLDSAKAGSWLEEEKYELVKFSPAVRLCRMKRQAIGKDFKHSLFSKTGPIFVSPKTDAPPAKDVRELLELCGADLKTSSKDAEIVVGNDLNKNMIVKCVEPCWILNCITKNKILPFKGPKV